MKDPVAPYHIKYTKNCQVPKEGHLGQFPANFCVKLKGTNGIKILIAILLIVTRASLAKRYINCKVLQNQISKNSFGLFVFVENLNLSQSAPF